MREENEIYKYTIINGSLWTVQNTLKAGIHGYNPKNHRFQIVDKTAKFKIVEGKDGFCYLKSDKDLKTIAKEKGLKYYYDIL